MSILAITSPSTGLVGVKPAIFYINTNDTLATITTARYINNNYDANIISFQNPSMCLVSNTSDGLTWLVATIAADGSITLSEQVSPGNVTLPVVSGDFAVFNGTSGLIKDAGYLPSNSAKTRVVMASGASIANHIATYSDTTGTIGEDSGTAINGGNIQAGLSGTAGYVASFPATSAKGSLRVTAVANTGDTVTTISNVAMGQASVVSIPDPATSTANFVLDTGTAVMASGAKITLAKGTGTESSNAVTISQQAGVITSTALTTAAGASETITLTNTKIATTSVVLVSIMGGTNTTPGVQLSATAGNGSSTILITNTNAAVALNGTIILGFIVA